MATRFWRVLSSFVIRSSMSAVNSSGLRVCKIIGTNMSVIMVSYPSSSLLLFESSLILSWTSLISAPANDQQVVLLSRFFLSMCLIGRSPVCAVSSCYEPCFWRVLVSFWTWCFSLAKFIFIAFCNFNLDPFALFYAKDYSQVTIFVEQLFHRFNFACYFVNSSW